METCSCDSPVRMYIKLCQMIGSVETTMPLSDDDDDDDTRVQVTPRRRVPLTTASHDDSDLVVKGTCISVFGDSYSAN